MIMIAAYRSRRAGREVNVLNVAQELNRLWRRETEAARVTGVRQTYNLHLHSRALNYRGNYKSARVSVYRHSTACLPSQNRQQAGTERPCDRNDPVAYYLGIDGGGSKTTCAVGDETSLLASVHAGPSNITRVGETRARESLHQAVHDACAAAKIDARQIRRACIGVAGAGRQEVACVVHKIVSEILFGEIEVVGDMQIALAAAFGAGPGVIVIAGTGSIAYARNARGETARAGGWGYAISDEGSAHWIGRNVVKALMHTVDRGAAAGTPAQEVAESLLLFRQLKVIWSVSSLDEFVGKANSNPDFAELFPAIVAAGEAGDEGSQRVLNMAGGALARLVRMVCQVFRRHKPEITAIPLAVAGGVFRYSERARAVFDEDVRKFDARLVPASQIVEPVLGALQMARNGRQKD